MQRFLNDPANIVEESLDGFIKSNPHLVSLTQNPRVIKYIEAPKNNKVGIASGGGSGHKPAFVGCIGRNMLDSVAVGDIFTPPSVEAFYDAIKAADSGNGVALLYGNYEGDVINAEKAIAMLAQEGIRVRSVIANDDVANAPLEHKEKRRGIAGEILMWKVGGAAAALGKSLDEIIDITQYAVSQMRSIGVGLSSCVIPTLGRPAFEIEEGTMHVGVGHHGDASLDIWKLKEADEIAQMMLDKILPDLPFSSGDEVVVLLSGLGATTLMEQYLMFNKVYDLLTDGNISIYRSYVGNYFTSLDMMGVTITLMKMNQELKELIDMEADCVALTQLKGGAV